jgi:hypothetical protein
MKIRCHTNLDLERCEAWPTDLPEIPRVGDYIESSFRWKEEQLDCRLQLAVCAVTWEFCENQWDAAFSKSCTSWEPRVELHLPPHRFENLTGFYEWYGRVTGKGKSAYI